MGESPLLRRARERLEKQRQYEQEQLEKKPEAYRKAMIRWMIRIALIVAVILVALYRFTGHSLY